MQSGPGRAVAGRDREVVPSIRVTRARLRPGGRDREAGMTTENPAAAPRSRWLVLAGYSRLVACTQLLWLSFAPVTTQAHHALGVSEGAIGDLAGINPLMYVLLALPAGRSLDRRFGRALSAGALLTAGGALLRLAGPTSYSWILACEAVLSAGQPLVLNATTKVAARYFPAAQRTAAISVASAAQFCGILAAALTGGPLQQAGGLRLLLLVQAVVAVAGAACVLVAVRVPAAFPAVSPRPSRCAGCAATGSCGCWPTCCSSA